MPLDTRTKAKGIPPRGRLPPKGKKAGSNQKSNKKKRNADSDSDESDGDKSNVAPVVRKKKPSKRRRASDVSESEGEEIDEDVEPPKEVVEEVDVRNAVGNDDNHDESEVSIAFD